MIEISKVGSRVDIEEMKCVYIVSEITQSSLDGYRETHPVHTVFAILKHR